MTRIRTFDLKRLSKERDISSLSDKQVQELLKTALDIEKL